MMYYIRNSKNKIVFYLKCVQFLLISFKHCNKHFTVPPIHENDRAQQQTNHVIASKYHGMDL